MDDNMKAAAREAQQQELGRIERECMKGSHLGGELGGPAVLGRRPHFNIFHTFGVDDPFISGVDPNSPLRQQVVEQASQEIEQRYGGSVGGGAVATTQAGTTSGGTTAGGQWIPGIDNMVLMIGAGAVAFFALRK